MLLLLLSCAHHPDPSPHSSGHAVEPRDLRQALEEGTLAVAPVALVKDLPAPPLAALPAASAVEVELSAGNEHLATPTVLDPQLAHDAAFLRNDYVGTLLFGGGFIRTGESALEVRARLIAFTREEELAVQGGAWLSGLVTELTADYPVAPIAVTPPAPLRTPLRGLHPDDGHDNLNLPRTALTPGPWTGERPAGQRYVLVPYLRSYYTHNGGWFLGQEFGCTGGARVEVLLVLYDLQGDGAGGGAVWWMDAVGRYIQPMDGQPSRAESDQYLLWAEDQVEVALGDGFLR